MADLTVLVAPTPLYPLMDGFTFGKRLSRLPNKPVMVTLDSEHVIPTEDEQKEQDPPDENNGRTSPVHDPYAFTPRRTRSPRPDANLLSPPVNTWKSPESQRERERERERTRRHRPTRSQSAPPERRFQREQVSQPSSPPSDMLYAQVQERGVRAPQRSFTSFSPNTGQLLPPPPPLLRPTTFWRKTRRSAVSAVSYAPSSYVVRRSTYIAAGLAFDAPIHDLSALSVESRVGSIIVPSTTQGLE